jgi:hypothetical protein
MFKRHQMAQKMKAAPNARKAGDVDSEEVRHLPV